MAQQRSHVPKFGSWDSNNIPYTAYFENARKEKGSGVKMNPNDPEENPEAFMFRRVSHGVSHAVRPPVHVNSDKSVSVENHKGHRRNTSVQKKSGSHRRSESGSDKSNSDYYLQQKNNWQTRPTRKKSISEVNNFVPSSLGPDRRRRESNPSDDMSYRSASVPKFGAWDEKDPKSGEGFTVLFNKVKEEKQIAAAKFPAVPPQPNNLVKSQKIPTGSMICCCLFGSGSD